MNIRHIGSFALASVLSFGGSALAQGTVFSYQGRLDDGASPATGTYDLQFAIYDSAGAGTQQGPTVTNVATAVNGGLFMVQLDFGAVFPGADRWLEIGVRTNGGGAFSTLSPRQKVTPTPYAVTAESLSGPLGSTGLSGTYSSAVTLNNAANVISGSFLGSGAGLSGVNAETLDGVSAGQFWRLTGNGGTTAGLNFLGTTDFQPLELQVNSTRALRLEPTLNDVNHSLLVNVIGGSTLNFVPSIPTASIYGATISGGGGLYFGLYLSNAVYMDFGTIGGGASNVCVEPFATVVGGEGNLAGRFYSTVLGGLENTASGRYSLAGGQRSVAGGDYSVALGSSKAIASEATAVGISTASGIASFAAGTSMASGASSTALGVSSASGDYSSALGDSTATGNYSSALGTSEADGLASVAMGYVSYAYGDYSLAAGAYSVANGNHATVSGGIANIASLDFSTIGGGQSNEVAGVSATIGGGQYNFAYGSSDTIGGGNRNIARGGFGGGCTVGGGYANQATNNYATVSGGASGTAWGDSSTVCGGRGGHALGSLSVVCGGHDNEASGILSFAAGEYALATLDGSFVWNSFPSYATSFADHRFHVFGANGFSVDYFSQRQDGGGTHWAGIGIIPGQTISTYNGAFLDDGGVWYGYGFVNLSDRNAKAGFEPVTPKTILEKVAALPITRWHFTNDVATTHLGPMAQDFYAAFNIGPDDRHIATVDEEGVALAAIQGLNQKLDEKLNEKDAEIQNLKQRLEKLEQFLNQRNGDAR